MTTASYALQLDMERRARQSRGVSNGAIYQMVSDVLHSRNLGGVLLDVGCGSGQLSAFVQNRFDKYIGVDAVRYPEFPDDVEFHFSDLNAASLPMADNSVDFVVAVETIEHLENPRAFMRELVRVAKPGGSVVITTPNQLSLLSLLTLVTKKQFNAFQDVHYPAHLTALLETDLRRIAAECSLEEIEVVFSRDGRLPFTTRHYPEVLTRMFPRQLSDNVLLIGKKRSDTAGCQPAAKPGRQAGSLSH